jgi:ABC-type multidrug transport system fused ATPase/permease subunit
MSGVRAFRRSLSLLAPRDRRRLTLVTVVQMATALLDLLGIMLIGIVVAAGVASATGESLPATVSTVLDAVGASSYDQLSVTLVLAVAAAVVLLAKSAINVTLARASLRFLAGRQAQVASRLALGLLSRPLLQIQERSSQDTVYTLTAGVGYAMLTVIGQGLVFVVEATLLVTLAVGLLVIDPILTLFTVVFFLLVAMAVQLSLSKWAVRQGRRTSGIEIDSIETVQEALSTYREMLVAGRRATYVNRFGDLRTQAATVQADLQFINLLPKYVFEVALVIGGGLLAASQLLTKDATAAVATLAVFLAAGSRIVPSLLRLQGALISVQSASAAAQPTLDLAAELDDDRSAGASGSSRALAPTADDLAHVGFDSSIEVAGVRFTYPGNSEPTLRDVSVSVAAGQSLALVGSTGAGKSTLADLILGVLTPEEGSVSTGGMLPSEVVLAWPGAIAYVPQTIAIINGTVRENVALGLTDDVIDDDLVNEALERAHLLDFLATTSMGVETEVGEGGVKLSGGQRQRLGIARALYTRPRLLVLDEATSALDAETEVLIGNTLRDLEGSVTTVTIAHRLATIRHCDQILFLDNGIVAARGTFDELRASSERFRHHAELLGL